MKINKDSLKARANNIAKELGISQNVVYDRFFYDAFLARLSKSPYKNQFVLKGGLYLSSVLGIDNRSTMDLDFYLSKTKMEKGNIVSIIVKIASLNINDGVTFVFCGESTIREDDLYGGFQVTLLGKMDNVKHQFNIDVATGDPIVPSERNYDYKCLVTGEVLPLKAYSLESVVSEKLETVLAKGISNSRSKDFYDLFVLRKTLQKEINNNHLIKAFKQTCEYRAFIESKEGALKTLEEIKNNSMIRIRWTSYGKKVGYAKDITLDEVIDAIKEWVEIVYKR